jgi:hypothetical protein
LKKVLIITYYWPPSGGAGVQRWLKFVKYLGEFGWEPIVYTADNPEYPIIDASFEKDIPKGITIIYFRLGLNIPFISSPDGLVIDSGNELSIWARLGAMASVAEPISKRTILRLDYSESLYLISTNGKSFEK